MTTIQDNGRLGLGFYAVPQAGFMDVYSAQQALTLLNLPLDYPLIECTFLPPQIKFKAPAQIALTGADFNWTIDNRGVELRKIITLNCGDVLAGQPAKSGLRGYIAINGKLNLKPVYGSYATYLNAKIGGFKGRLLRAGDSLTWSNSTHVAKQPDLHSQPLKRFIIPLKSGPEFQYLSQESQIQLAGGRYKISADSNRMGARLLGFKLTCSRPQLNYSLPVLPGFVQLPPSGQPIVLLQDGQVSGGYPRIAYIPTSYLSEFNQIPFGVEFKFKMLE